MAELGAGLALLSSQLDQQRIQDTRALLGDAQDALIGFAIALREVGEAKLQLLRDQWSLSRDTAVNYMALAAKD